METTLRYGQAAPDFSLPSSLGREVTLGEFKGQADLVLAFFCYAWGGI
jgi:peroxiredoxin